MPSALRLFNLSDLSATEGVLFFHVIFIMFNNQSGDWELEL